MTLYILFLSVTTLHDSPSLFNDGQSLLGNPRFLGLLLVSNSSLAEAMSNV